MNYKPDEHSILIQPLEFCVDEKMLFQKLNFSIELEEYESNKRVVIGQASIILSTDTFEDWDETELEDEFYAFSDGGAERIASTIFKKNWELPKYFFNKYGWYDTMDLPYLFILDKLVLKDEYRNCGIGSMVLNMLESIYGVSRLKLLLSAPILYGKGNYEGNDYEDVRMRLDTFYKKAGYKRINKSKNQLSVFYKYEN